MSRSEDVLLVLPEVKFKKNDGTLYIMKERVAFIVENRDSVLISHSFYDIKMQKISPEGKPKIQLQLVLHDGNSSTFHFVNRGGQQKQIEDREKVKNIIQNVLPNFKRKIGSDLEEKSQILAKNPRLLDLYKGLVISESVTSEDFWLLHGKQVQSQNSNLNKQEIGISGAFLSEIKPVTDGCNGLKYNLTSENIGCIFKAYPAVKKKHTENVPAKMTESEFWTNFFTSHYFHRDQDIKRSKDIFAECGKIDDHALKKEIKNSSGDPLLDLTKFGDNTIEDGFCSSNIGEQKSDISNGGGNVVHQSIIKRFNQHSFMVLKSCKKQPPTATVVSSEQKPEEKKVNGTSEKKRKHAEPEIEVPPPTVEELEEQLQKKKQRIAEKIQYNDLGTAAQETDNMPITSINLERLERYLYGPTATNKDKINRNNEYNVEMLDQVLRQNSTKWDQRVPHKQLLNPSNAVNALGELSPGGLLMRGYQDHNLSQFVPPDYEKELKIIYLSAGELLKEFWSSFPPTTPELEAKFVKMHEIIQRFAMLKMRPFEDRATRELSTLGAQLLSHLNLLIDVACKKFNTWQDKKVHKIR